MKKLVNTLLIVCLILSFESCGKTADDNEGMLQIIAEEEGISDKLLMQIIGTVELGDTLLMCAMSGNENQGYQYFAAEFKQKENKYEFIHSYKLYKRGIDMYSLLWDEGYVFLSNNENCKYLQIILPSGEQLITIDEVPFVYYLDLSEEHRNNESSFEYYFLNENSEVISQ